MSKDATQTTTTRPDQQTSAWIDLWRRNIGNAQNGLGNPAYAGVRSNMQSDFDRQRALATMQGNDLATKAGAFGGSRASVLNAQLQQGVNQAETSALSGLDLQENQEQFQRLMALLGLQGQAAGVGGSTQSMQMPGSGLGGLIGGAATLLGGPLGGLLFKGGEKVAGAGLKALT